MLQSQSTAHPTPGCPQIRILLHPLFFTHSASTPQPNDHCVLCIPVLPHHQHLSVPGGPALALTLAASAQISAAGLSRPICSPTTQDIFHTIVRNIILKHKDIMSLCCLKLFNFSSLTAIRNYLTGFTRSFITCFFYPFIFSLIHAYLPCVLCFTWPTFFHFPKCTSTFFPQDFYRCFSFP